MVQIGEIIAKLELGVNDKSKKVRLIAKLKDGENIQADINNICEDNNDGTVVISNAKTIKEITTVKNIIFNLFLYQSDKEAKFAIYNSDKSKLIVYTTLPKLSNIKVVECNDYIEMYIYINNEEEESNG